MMAAAVTTAPIGHHSNDRSGSLRAGLKNRERREASPLRAQAGRAIATPNTAAEAGSATATPPAAVKTAVAPMSTPQFKLTMTIGSGARKGRIIASAVGFAPTTKSSAATRPAPKAIAIRCAIVELSRAFQGG